MPNPVLAHALAGLAVAASLPAQAVLVDFESIPGLASPADGVSIRDQFLASAGIRFALEGGGFPVLAKVGAPQTAFGGPPSSNGADNPAAGQNIGQFFLTDDGVVNGSARVLLIDYAMPTAGASGVILDIDGGERWTIQARDASGAVLGSVLLASGAAGTGDGIATPWSFRFGSNVISSLRISGTKPSGDFGLGFDNFQTTPVPEPQTTALLLTGLGVLGFAARKVGRAAA